MLVIGPDGNKWYGNDATGTGSVDYDNPQEQVYIADPALGKYVIYISCSAFVADDVQTAAIVVTSAGYVSAEPAAYNGGIPGGYTSQPNTVAEYQTFPPPDKENSSYSKSFFISEVLSNDETDCVATFSLRNGYIISGVTIDLDGSQTGGSGAFLFTILMQSPSNLLVQLGGYQKWFRTFDIIARVWPVQWAQKATGSEAFWSSTRNLQGMNLGEAGRWSICLSVVYKSWPSMRYTGTITIEMIASSNSNNASKSQHFLSRVGDWFVNNSVTLISFFTFVFIAFAVVVTATIYKRKQLTDELYLLSNSSYGSRGSTPAKSSAIATPAKKLVWPKHIYDGAHKVLVPEETEEIEVSNFMDPAKMLAHKVPFGADAVESSSSSYRMSTAPARHTHSHHISTMEVDKHLTPSRPASSTVTSSTTLTSKLKRDNKVTITFHDGNDADDIIPDDSSIDQMEGSTLLRSKAIRSDGDSNNNTNDRKVKSSRDKNEVEGVPKVIMAPKIAKKAVEEAVISSKKIVQGSKTIIQAVRISRPHRHVPLKDDNIDEESVDAAVNRSLDSPPTPDELLARNMGVRQGSEVQPQTSVFQKE